LSARLYRHGTEEELARLALRQTQVFVDGLSSLIGQLETYRPPRLLLANGCSIQRVTAWSNVIDADGDNVAAAKFAVDRQVEECKIPLLALDLQLGSNRSNLARPQRRFCADKFSFLARHANWLAKRIGNVLVPRSVSILEVEARTVRMIFRRYAEIGSVRALGHELYGLGVISKRRESDEVNAAPKGG